VSDKRLSLLGHRECTSARCHRRATHLASAGTTSELPDAYCFDCLRVLTDEAVKLRPSGRIRSLLWRAWDETRAHHHTVASFVLAGLTLQAGLGGWRPWLILALLASSAVADLVAMHRMTYRLWPLSIPPLAMALAVPALLGQHWVSMLALTLAVFHAALLALVWHHSFHARYDPGPPRPGSSRPGPPHT